MTYLGRVEARHALARAQGSPSSRDRLLDASNGCSNKRAVFYFDRMVAAKRASRTHVLSSTSATSRTSCATRWSAKRPPRKLSERFATAGDPATERAKLLVGARIDRWVLLRPGLFRAWHVTSNHDREVVAERQRRFEANSKHGRYIERLHQRKGELAPFSAYAIIPLVAPRRAKRNDKAFSEAKHEGIISVVTDLAGL